MKIGILTIFIVYQTSLYSQKDGLFNKVNISEDRPFKSIVLGEITFDYVDTLKSFSNIYDYSFEPKILRNGNYAFVDFTTGIKIHSIYAKGEVFRRIDIYNYTSGNLKKIFFQENNYLENMSIEFSEEKTLEILRILPRPDLLIYQYSCANEIIMIEFYDKKMNLSMKMKINLNERNLIIEDLSSLSLVKRSFF